MVNLIAGREVVPELIQQDFTPEKVIAEMRKIIPDGEPRQQMIEGLRRVKTLLRSEISNGHRTKDPASPADKAAAAIFGLTSG